MSRFFAQYLLFFKKKIHHEQSGNASLILRRLRRYFKKAFDFPIKTLMIPLILSFPIIGSITLPFKLLKEWLRQRSRPKNLRHAGMISCDILASSLELVIWASMIWFLYLPLLSYKLNMIPLIFMEQPMLASVASFSTAIGIGLFNCASAIGNRIALYFTLMVGMQVGKSFLKIVFSTKRASQCLHRISKLVELQMLSYICDGVKSLWAKMMPELLQNENKFYPITPIPEYVDGHNKSTVIDTYINGTESKSFFKHYPFGDQTKALDVPNTFTPRYKKFHMHGCDIEVDYISERHFKLSISSPRQFKI